MIATDHLDELFHIGTPRHSGRYPWGSGDNPYQRNASFLAQIDDLKKKGLTEAEIAKGFGISTAKLRAAKSIAKNEKRKADEAQALQLKEKGYSNVAIGERMGIGESQVRNLLNPSNQVKSDILFSTSDMLRKQIEEKGYLDIGEGVENHIGISNTKMKTAVAVLENEGYSVYYVKTRQLGTGKETTVKVLAPPDTTYSDVYKNQDKIRTITDYSEDGGRTYLGIEPPQSVSSKRVGVRYGDEGGSDMDGVIQLRRGVDDISLGQSNYAQVRIMVDGTHYLKGMAMYSDNMPDGVDILFNTNKNKDTPMYGPKDNSIAKPLKSDEDNPFGSTVRQRHYIGADGKKRLSPLNIVGTEDPDGIKTPGEEGGWSQWSKRLSSQMLSKQSPSLAKEQLDLTYKVKKSEYDEIMSLTNPAVKKKLLESFADGADASAVHLKAAGLPRTANHVILPINSLKDSEIYAPNYRNGEKVVLIRHPHGGKFEIPELTVNNRNKEALSVMKQAKDAVGINSKVAQRLSGADFDGDTVLVIPNNSGKVKTSPSLAGLKGFDPQTAYPGYEGMKPMSPRLKQTEMGKISNLITDMTIGGASSSELARAVKHSMVVIDAEKHKLNYRQSAKDNDIQALKKRYQPAGGASTLISRASSEVRLNARKPRPMALGGPVDPATGKKVFVDDSKTYTDKKGRTKTTQISSTRMAETDDANTLSSGTVMEKVYANHANRLKSLANNARKESLTIKPQSYSPSAKKVYSKEVASLDAKLNISAKNKPLERQAQLIGNAVVKAKMQATPDMDPADIKKVKSQALKAARERTGASKQNVQITPQEWEAIQAGAISNNKLSKILDNTDLDLIKQYAMPKSSPAMSPSRIARARAMLNSGYTQADVADAMGVSTSTLSAALK